MPQLNTQTQIALYEAAKRRQMEEQQKAAQRKAMGKLLGDIIGGGGAGYGGGSLAQGATAGSTALGGAQASGMLLPELAPMVPTASSTAVASAPAMGFSSLGAASVAAPLALYALATRPGGFGTADTTPRPWDPNRVLKELDAFKLAPGLADMNSEQQISFLNQNKKFIGYRGAGVEGGKDIPDIERDFPTSAWKVYRPAAIDPFQKSGDVSDRKYRDQELLQKIDPDNWMNYGSGQGVTDWRRVPLEIQAKAVMQDPRMSEKYKESVKRLLEDYNQKNKTENPTPPPKATNNSASQFGVDFGGPVGDLVGRFPKGINLNKLVSGLTK